MLFTIPERIHLMGILPKESNFITLRVVRGMIDKIGLSDNEMLMYEVKEENGVITWNEKGNIPIDIELSKVELDIIKIELQRLNDSNKITMNLFTLYEKVFV